MYRRAAAIYAVLALGIATAAHADKVMTSAPLTRFGRSFHCNVANAGKKPVVVSIQVVESDGDTFGATMQPTVAPGTSTRFGVAGAVGSDSLFCRFTIIEGNKRGLRANACVLTTGDGSAPCMTSTEAR